MSTERTYTQNQGEIVSIPWRYNAEGRLGKLNQY